MQEENVWNTTKSHSNFAPTFVGHHLFPDKNFNEHGLMNSISIPKKSNKSKYFIHTKSTINKFKHRFYTR